jgi:hypothetical protein
MIFVYFSSNISFFLRITKYKTVWVWNMVSDIKGRTYRVFENRVLRRIFGPERDEETGGRRNLFSEYN